MPSSLTTPFDVSQPNSFTRPGPGVEPEETGEPGQQSPYTDEELLELWEELKTESLDTRKAFDVQWRRNIYYILFRQWIEYIAGKGWRDKRMALFIPRPVTNKCKDVLTNIRAMFTAIKLGVSVRPNGADPKNVSAAATADELAPVLHERHNMDTCLSEFDFWLIACGNAYLHTFVDYDVKYGLVSDPTEQCVQCGNQYKSSEIPNSTCPDCGGTKFTPALDEQGQPIVEHTLKGRPTTLVLSPLELAYPNSYARFEDLPYVIRMRWRTKRYFESNPALKPLMPRIAWEQSPIDENLNLFHAMAKHNDLGITTGYMGGGNVGTDEEGTSEYEVWMKPTSTYPQGLVFRVYGQANAVVAHLEQQESIPGPLPYTDVDGNPLFTFCHAGYEHVGGRVYASGPIDAMIHKQDQLNQLDSMIMLQVNRTSSPSWIVPKGAEIQKFTGVPGVVYRYNAAVFGGQAEPELVPGIPPSEVLFQLRSQYLQDIEDLTGASDALKGIKPGGDMPFSALQLLVERSQARYANVFQSRGHAYTEWFKFAVELEREFGPDDLTKATLSPNKRWTFQNFKRSNLAGSMTMLVEDGSNAPKTNLGMRASMEHAAGLGILNMQDPDQKYEALRLLGLSKMIPTLDVHVQAALLKQQNFEEWVANPQQVQQFVQQAQQAQQQYQMQVQQAQQEQAQLAAAPMPPGGVVPPAPQIQAPNLLDGSPLKWKKWFDPTIHRQELIKWANGDNMREVFAQNQMAEKLVEAHLTDIEEKLAEIQQQQMQMQAQADQAKLSQPQPAGGTGAGRAMANSNNESTKGVEPPANQAA